ncbi:DUF3006 domain-containing protein [Bacillus sp. 1P06AnD]|uniref:DUF3006 domain-containing protein n=1 Tax=Bacillus sp. 1P06AnD TaxID=3132208 RepID=UPI00399FB11A
MTAIVDSFEGDYMVLEVDGTVKDIPRCEVEASVQVGDVVRQKNGKWYKDEEQTKARQKKIKSLMDSVWEDE